MRTDDLSASRKQVLKKPDRIPTIRSTLALLVTACVLPALLMAVMLISYYYQHGKNQLVRDSILTARAMMFAIDKQLANAQATLLALATSPHLDSNDFPALYRPEATGSDRRQHSLDRRWRPAIYKRFALGEPLILCVAHI